MELDNMFSIFKISGSGLSAQRKAVQASADNIANAETTRTESGGPYRPKRVAYSETEKGVLFKEELNRAGRLHLRKESDKHFTRNMDAPGRGGTQGRAASGVEARVLRQQKNAVKMVYDPQHPDADQNGNVKKPNINLVREMTDMMVASRLYEANLTVLNAAKGMIGRAIKI